MRRLARIVTVALLTFGSSFATAQETAQPEVTETKYTDWTVICVQPEGSGKLCEMAQVVEDGDRTLLRVVISKIGGTIEGAPELIALAQIFTPVGVILPEGIVQRVDRNEERVSQFLYCLPGHCYSRFALSKSEIDEMKKGRNYRITLQVLNEEEPESIRVSLRGFRRAFNAL